MNLDFKQDFQDYFYLRKSVSSVLSVCLKENHISQRSKPFFRLSQLVSGVSLPAACGAILTHFSAISQSYLPLFETQRYTFRRKKTTPFPIIQRNVKILCAFFVLSLPTPPLPILLNCEAGLRSCRRVLPRDRRVVARGLWLKTEQTFLLFRGFLLRSRRDFLPQHLPP